MPKGKSARKEVKSMAPSLIRGLYPNFERDLDRICQVLEGHFVKGNGQHTPSYIKNRSLSYERRFIKQVAEILCLLCNEMIAEMRDPRDILITGPSYGANELATAMADVWDCDKVLLVKEERRPDGVINFHFDGSASDIVRGRQVLLVDDFFDTGTTIKRAIKAVQKAGGGILGIAVIVNLSNKFVHCFGEGTPLVWFGRKNFESYSEKECPLCKDDVPINTDRGRGEAFLRKMVKKGEIEKARRLGWEG